MSGQLFGKTLTESEQIDLLIDDKLAVVNTVIPCKVVAVAYPKVNVQPLIKRVFYDANQVAQYLDYGVLTDIPIMTLGNTQFNISFPPPSIDDIGVLYIPQASTNNAYNTGEINSSRKFDLADAIFIPQFIYAGAVAGQLVINSAGQTIINSSDKMTINVENDVIINVQSKFNVNNLTDELVASLIQTLTAIRNGSTVPGGGPLDPSTIAAIDLGLNKVSGFV